MIIDMNIQGELLSRQMSRTPAASVPAAPKACEPLRADAPQRLPHRRGALPDLSDPTFRDGALGDLDRDMFSASARASNKNKLQTVTKALAFFGYPLYRGGQPTFAP